VSKNTTRIHREGVGPGVTVGSTITSRRTTGVLWTPHAGGTLKPDSSHALGYVHVATGTAADRVSEGFIQPFPAFTELFTEVNVGTGSVGMVPVWVYCGRSVIAPAFEMLEGGHAFDEETSAAIWPAPEPPVCEGASGGCHGLGLPQTPSASRGSVGIHPLFRPS
jgi:hypothetical protein